MEIFDMPSNVDAGAEPQTGIVSDDLLKLTINVLFDRLPLITDPNNSTDEFAVKPISPVLRFPMELSAKDAGIIQEAFQTAIPAAISLQIDNADGSPRHYRLLRTQ
jgi:hypothetical protein